MSKRMKLVAAVSVLAAPGLLVLTAGPSQSATTVPTCPATSLTKTAGSQSGYINQTNNNQTWNLTGAVWNSTPTSSHYYPVRSDAFTKGCIIGGLALSGNAFSAKAAIISASICADAADAGPVAACCPAFRRIAFISLSNSSSISQFVKG